MVAKPLGLLYHHISYGLNFNYLTRIVQSGSRVDTSLSTAHRRRTCPISTDFLADLLMQFLHKPTAARLAQQYGMGSTNPYDHVGEIYYALVRQRPVNIENPKRGVYANAKWHLRNSIRRERRELLGQPARNQLLD